MTYVNRQYDCFMSYANSKYTRFLNVFKLTFKEIDIWFPISFV